MHSRQPAIVAVAKKLGRGTNSLAMKLVNLASLDPSLRMRGIKGLPGASALDKTMWEEYHENLAETAPASEAAFQALFGAEGTKQVEVIPTEGVRVRQVPVGPTEIERTSKERRGQDYFRDVVLNNFGGRCGVCGLAIRELLVASHILPWSKHEAERLNVRNGLALSRLHDAAFDNWLIAFDDNLRLLLSPRMRDVLQQKAIADNFGAYAGEVLKLPDDAVLPDPAFLAAHRKVFLKKR